MALRELRVDFEAHNTAPRSNRLGRDGGVVANTAPDMKEAISRTKIEAVEPPQKRSRLAVVQEAVRIERHQHGIVEMTRIVVGRESIATRKIRRTQNLPRSRADEVFARDGGQSTHEGRRPQPDNLAKPLREFNPYPLKIDRVVHSLTALSLPD